jgi:hypothetical protein
MKHGPARVGHDGDFIGPPAETTAIRRTNRLNVFL